MCGVEMEGLSHRWSMSYGEGRHSQRFIECPYSLSVGSVQKLAGTYKTYLRQDADADSEAIDILKVSVERTFLTPTLAREVWGLDAEYQSTTTRYTGSYLDSPQVRRWYLTLSWLIHGCHVHLTLYQLSSRSRLRRLSQRSLLAVHLLHVPCTTRTGTVGQIYGHEVVQCHTMPYNAL
jgi:hypothetical protein